MTFSDSVTSTQLREKMPLLDFFRNFFGLQQPTPENSQHRDGFRNPIWQNDDDEEDINNFSRQSGSSYSVYSDPFQVTLFFKSQIDEILSNFFGGFDGFGNRFPNSFPNEDFSNTLPPSSNEKLNKGLRDEVLKSDSKSSIDEFVDLFPEMHSSPNPCDEVLKPSFEMPDPSNKKLDSDIDGKIKSDELAKIWKTPFSKLDSYSPQINIHSIGSSVLTQIVKRPDGSIEELHSIKDSNGNEEIKITRQIGDKIHSIITKKLKDGSETTTEDIINMTEGELKGFDGNWKKTKIPKEDQKIGFPWHKFFGPYPKL